MKKLSLLTICFLMISLIMSGYAFAHKVTVFAWVEGDMVYGECKFSGGKRTKNAPIEVFDINGKKLLETKTNENGEFSFKAPQKTDMKIVLKAGTGHRGEWMLRASEFGEPDNVPAEKAAPETEKVEKTEISGHGTKAETPSPCLAQKELKNMIEKSLDKKLKPVIRKLNEALDPNHDPTMSDIFGGLGYILGLVGVGAYFNFRNKKG